MTKTWFITGTSSGFGREWAAAALQRGDNVAATARSLQDIEDLTRSYSAQIYPLAVDVTDQPAVEAVLRAAHDHFGRIDVVVNNAGYGAYGAVEEITPAQARAQFETNVFGSLWVLKAAIPLMRAQGAGRIIQVSSIGGILASPTLGVYNASKWAVEAIVQALAEEVKGFGIAVTLVEPVMYGGVDWSRYAAQRLPEYDGARGAMRASYGTLRPGAVGATRAAILALVDAEEPPLRVLFGDNGLELIRAEYQRRLEEWEDWNGLSQTAQGQPE